MSRAVLESIRLSQDQATCLHEIYDHLVKTGEWPLQRTFVAEIFAKHQIDLARACNGIERLVHGRTESKERVRLVLPALELIGGADAVHDIDAFLRFLRAIGETRVKNPTATEILGEDIIAPLGLSPAEEARLEQHFLASGLVLTGVGAHKDGLRATRFALSDRYLPYGGFSCLDDLLRDLYSFYAPYYLPADGYGVQVGRDYDLRSPLKFRFSMLAGMTDFAGTNLQQMRDVVGQWLEEIEDTANRLTGQVNALSPDDSVAGDIRVLRSGLHRMYVDLLRLHAELRTSVAQRHIALLSMLDQLRRELDNLCVEFKRDFLEGPRSRPTSVARGLLERIYADTRDCVIGLSDISNLRSQLETFVGWEASSTRGEAVRILFVVAQPKDETRIRVDRELRDVIDQLGNAKYRDRIRCDLRLATRVTDLTTALHQTRPSVLHFSGHGVERVNASRRGGLVFENNHGNAKTVLASKLAKLLTPFSLRLLVLNACFSDQHASVFQPAVPAVVGMRDAIYDDTAIDFAVGLYEALAFGWTLQKAFDIAVARLSVIGRSGVKSPMLRGHPPSCLGERIIEPP